MADENLDMESVRISELDQTTEVDRANDYLVVSRHSDAYIDDEKSFKITPDDLLAGVGVNYTAGAHIAIDNNTHTISATYTNATTSADGLMSKEDKSTVDSLQPVATSGDYNDLTNKPTIPAAQVNSDWNSNSGVSEILNKPTLATVATTGDYSDLSNTPTIPAAQVNSDWNSNSGVSQILNKPQLSAVATSGSYTDLSNIPTIPEDLADLGDVDITSTSLSDNQVLKYDANSGKWINSTGGGGGGASDLNDLDDVTITTPSENQVLKYNGTQWVNATSPAGATNLDGLTDVTIATPTAGQALVYDGTSGEWENTAVDYANIANTPTIPDAISDLTDDVSITNPENDEVLKYDATSSKWINAAAPAGASSLGDLTDVTISAPLNNQALLYDNTNHTWINKAVEGSVPVKDIASGAIANFETNLAEPYQSVIVDVEATGGNGTPDNPNPINGYSEANLIRCGVNLFDKTEIFEGYINDTNGNYSANANYKCTDYIPVKGGLDYYIKSEQSGSNWGAWYDSEKSYIEGLTIYANKVKTAPSNACFARLTIWASGSGNVDTFGFNYPATDTTYHAYTGNTYTIAFGQTVYGGVLDVTRGKLHVTWGYAHMSELEWIGVDSPNGVFQAGVPNFESPSGYDERKTGFICNIYPASNVVSISSSMDDKSLLRNSGRIYAHDTDYNDVTLFKNSLTSAYLTFKLATPFDIDLTHEVISAVVGINNVFADCGETEVEYYTSTASDIKEFINSSITVEDLANIEITTPSEGDTLVYDSTSSKWVNGAGGGGSAKQTAVTQAEYNALVQAGTVDPTMEYFITDGIPYQVFPWTELIATLTAGSTTLVFTSSAITTNSTIDPYVDDSFYGVNPTAVVIANGSVTLTFNEQANDIPVKVRIS